MPKPGATGLRRIIDAAGYSSRGITAALKHESAFRQEMMLALIMLPLAVWVGENAIEYSLLIGSLLLVLIVELLNSAVETVVDRISDERHVLSGRAKDMGSAAVLFSLFNVLLIWGLIIFQNFFNTKGL